MASYQQYFEYRFNTLPTSTIYRFAEMEIYQYLNNLRPFINVYEPQLVTAHLDQVLFPSLLERHEARENGFHSTLTSRYLKPHKQELLSYFLFHHQSYRKITEITGISPNTISKYKYQSAPILQPLYKHWNETMLHRWRSFRQTQNLWNETLVHSVINEQDPDTYDDTDFYEGLTRNPFNFHRKEK